MAATENLGPAIAVNEVGDSVVKSGHEMMDDPIPSNHFSIGQKLNLGIINQFGQLVGEYSRLDDELWLSKSQDDDAAERSNESLQWDLSPSCKNAVDLGQLSYCVDMSVCDGGTSVRGKSSSLKDISQSQSQIPSPVSVLQARRSDSDARTAMHSQRQLHQPRKHHSSGGLQTLCTTFSASEQSLAFQSESEYSMESSVLDESEDSTSAKDVRTRKISDLLVSDSERAAKKCVHCGTTETPQWRTGPMGRKTLCNACGVQYKHGRLYPDYRPLRSPSFDPSLHTNWPKKVQKRMLKTNENCPTPTPKANIVEERTSAFDPSLLHSSADKQVKDMVMGKSITKPKEVERTPSIDSSLLSKFDKRVQEMIMGETSDKCSARIPKPKESDDPDYDPSLESRSAKTWAIGMGKTSRKLQNILPETERVEEMRLGNYKKNDQNHDQRAMKFPEIREKDSNLPQPDYRDCEQNFDFESSPKRKKPSKAIKACQHCESTETPQWREGPMGRHTLCNACGVQYRNGRLFPEYRPLKSPTYDPSLHSHLPKKVLEMRMSNSKKCATSGY